MRAELMELADTLDPHTAKVLVYASRVVALVKPDTVSVVASDKIKSADVG